VIDRARDTGTCHQSALVIALARLNQRFEQVLLNNVRTLRLTSLVSDSSVCLVDKVLRNEYFQFVAEKSSNTGFVSRRAGFVPWSTLRVCRWKRAIGFSICSQLLP
jgi:hypothetical protein